MQNLYKKYMKRILDIVFSLLGIILAFPVVILIGIAIKADSKGPVFFKQSRLGVNGQEFKIFKFRTMIEDAESLGTGLSIRSLNDNRITKVGNLLRKSSLDELPQLFNIVSGDMSFIGPRPPVTYFPYDGYENYPEWMQERFSVKPGITGLAQVVYRNNALWDERIKLDVEYVKNLSLLNDCKLLIQTVIIVFKNENVYGEILLNENEYQSNKENSKDV